MKIAVTLCTRERPIMLRSCLQSLAGLHIPDGVSVSVVVVENNETDSCRGIIEEIASQPGALPIVYVHEPRLGIPIARNRTLDIALADNPDWIAFIDDDEEADPDWIVSFVAAAGTLEADVLQGPVEWVHAEGGAIDKERWDRPTGSLLKTAPTNNTFMRARIARVDGMGLRFDETMRFTGGSDSDFFFRAADRGAVIRWMNDAVVRESVPAERLTLRWRTRRARQTAANNTNIYMRRKGRLNAVIRYVPKSFRRLLRAGFEFPVGIALYPFSPRHGLRITTSAACKVWWAFGSLGVALNIKRLRPEPYRTIEGC